MNKQKVSFIVFCAIITILVSGCTIGTTEPHLKRIWQAPPVLIELTEYPGLSSNIFLTVPRLVLYADGRIVTSRRSSDDQSIKLFQAKLTVTQICELLGQIEADGFFDLKPSEYKPPRITDASTTSISVMAWRTQKFSAYALHIAVAAGPEASKMDAFVPTSLAKAYQQLRDYQPSSATPYEPERIALLVAGPVKAKADAPEWQAPNLTLAELATRRAGRWNAVILENAEASQVLNRLDNNWRGRIFNEDGQWYGLNLSPLVPLQSWPPNSELLPQPYAYPLTPTTQLECDNK